jgi:CRISPR-associated protein Csb2
MDDMEIVQVATMVPPDVYIGGGDTPKGPESWIKAICMTTADFLSDGWSRPPAMQLVDYVLRRDALQAKVRPKPIITKKEIRCANYALHSKVLPSVKDTLPFAERIRAKLMGVHRRIMNGDGAEVSRLFCGKTREGEPLKGHQHVFYQPLDQDGDGRLDHLIISSTEPFNRSELAALDRLRSIWQRGGRPDVQLILTSLSEKRKDQSSKVWVSETPFVIKRHYRKGRGLFGEWLNAEVVKECAFHNLPAPTRIEFISSTPSSIRPLRWAEFVRSRKNATPHIGYGCILEFSGPVQGPFAIGAGCHFGLGLFKPA